MARCLVLLGAIGVELCAGVVLEGAGGAHLPDRRECGVLDRDDCLDRSAAGCDAPVLAPRWVRALRALDIAAAPRALQVGVAWAGFGGLDPPGRLVHSWVVPAHEGEAASGGKRDMSAPVSEMTTSAVPVLRTWPGPRRR
jgi:hypothetical protein